MASHFSKFPLSVTLISLNEELSIHKAIESVIDWAEEVLVVDSGSTDKTLEIAQDLKAKVLYNRWTGYGQQKNFAQRHTKQNWVLNIDADEIVTTELALEIQALFSLKKQKFMGFYLPRKTYYCGHWIRHGGWYPNYQIRLTNKNFSKWTEPYVHERCIVSKPTGYLNHPLLHFAFHQVQDQITTNLRFSQLGALDLKTKQKKAGLIQLIFKPFGKFIETYLLKRGILDGLSGFIISINAAYSMFLKYAYCVEEKIHYENTRNR